MLKYRSSTFLKTKKPHTQLSFLLLVIKQLQFILFSGRVYVRALIQQTPHTQLSFNLLQLLTLMSYLWVQSFNQTQRKIGAYRFASQPFTSRVKSTIIVHDNLHPTGYIYQDLSNTMCLPKDKM